MMGDDVFHYFKDAIMLILGLCSEKNQQNIKKQSSRDASTVTIGNKNQPQRKKPSNILLAKDLTEALQMLKINTNDSLTSVLISIMERNTTEKYTIFSKLRVITYLARYITMMKRTKVDTIYNAYLFLCKKMIKDVLEKFGAMDKQSELFDMLPSPRIPTTTMKITSTPGSPQRWDQKPTATVKRKSFNASMVQGQKEDKGKDQSLMEQILNVLIDIKTSVKKFARKFYEKNEKPVSMLIEQYASNVSVIN